MCCTSFGACQVITVSGHPTWETTHGVNRAVVQRMKERWEA